MIHAYIPANGEAEARELQVRGWPRQFSKILSRKKKMAGHVAESSLGLSLRYYIKKKGRKELVES